MGKRVTRHFKRLNIPNIKFIYSVGSYNIDREKVITNICNKIYQHLSLPDYIEIEFKYLPDNVYAEALLNYKFKNRIYINENLNLKEIVKPLVHELIHLNQIHIGKLSTNGRGIILWEGSRYSVNQTLHSYTDYCNLPWEIDAMSREPKLLKILLEN